MIRALSTGLFQQHVFEDRGCFAVHAGQCIHQILEPDGGGNLFATDMKISCVMVHVLFSRLCGCGNFSVAVTKAVFVLSRGYSIMAIHFTASELQQRRDRFCSDLEKLGLKGVLLFRQESMYYLTGYESFGYCFFQCMVLGVDGRLALLTRAPDLRQAQHTSIVDDIRIWVDDVSASPALQLKDLLHDLGWHGSQLGIELDAVGLTAHNWNEVRRTLGGLFELSDVSDVTSRMRMVKSPAELGYVERAAVLADDALDAAIAVTAAGADEGDILAAMQSAVFSGGGDYPGNEFIIGSGEDALLCRYHSGRRVLDAIDQLTLEFAGVYRRYHACLMRTLVIGEPTHLQLHMHRACADAMEACLEQIRPGCAMGEVFDAHARVMDNSGMLEHRLNACGYSLGATFTPTWMDYPMFYKGNPEPIVPGMVLFLHMILMNSLEGTAMTLGQTIRIDEDGPVRLSRHDTRLITC